jgi:hypothetical protein
MELYKKLTEIQSELKAPKKQWNKFGNYSYRRYSRSIKAFALET